MESGNILRRYTDISSLIHLIKAKKVTFLNPKNWDDQNDAYFMEQYRKRKKLKTLLAICFTETSETYHHWKVFSKDYNGVCICFKKDDFIQQVCGKISKPVGTNYSNRQILHREIDYKTLNEISSSGCSVDSMPFIKRYAYMDEQEYRFIYQNGNEKKDYYEVDIELSCIDRIIINPWMTDNIRKSAIATLKELTSEYEIKITKSTVVKNDTWQQYAKNAT